MDDKTAALCALAGALEAEIGFLRDGYDTLEHGIANSLQRIHDDLIERARGGN